MRKHNVKIEYRLAHQIDLSEIVLLVKTAIQTMENNHIHQWDEIYPTKEDFAEDIRQDNLYIGVSEGKIAVVFALNKQCDEAYQNGHWQYPDREFCVVHRLCVNPHFQHKGVAKQTMQFIEEKCKAEGITAVRLDAFSHNPSALKLYSRMGYSRVGYAHWRKGRFYLFEKYL